MIVGSCADSEGSAYAIAIFHKHVIVSTDRDQEKHDLHIIKDVYPLLSF